MHRDFAVKKTLRKVDRQEDRRASDTRFLPQYRRLVAPFRIVIWPPSNAVQPTDRPNAAWSIGSSRMQLSPDPKDQTAKFSREGCGVSPSYRRRVTGKEIQRAGVAPYGATPGTNITVASCTTWLDLACNISSTCNEACTRARTFVHLATVLVSSRNIIHIIVLPFPSRDL